MIVQNGRIIEATENELYNRYLTGNFFEHYTFGEFLCACEKRGVKITKDESVKADSEGCADGTTEG
jgi:hypothetical protein